MVRFRSKTAFSKPNFDAEVKTGGKTKRHQVIAFRITERERAQTRAQKAGMTQQEYLLRAALETPIHVVAELKPILSELRACGRNLNQLTMLAHQGYIQAVGLQETAETLGKTYDAINALLMQKDRVISHGNM